MDDSLLGKCGFYCGACPTYIIHNCKGCIEEHTEGDCFTRDCVMRSSLKACGECSSFPCNDIMEREHATVLDKDWLRWKQSQRQ